MSDTPNEPPPLKPKCMLQCGRDAYEGLPYCRECIEMKPIPALAGIDETATPRPDNVRRLPLKIAPQPAGSVTPGAIVEQLRGLLQEGDLSGVMVMARHADGKLSVHFSELPKELALTMADLLLTMVRKHCFGE